MREQSSIKFAAGVFALLLIVPLVSTGGFAAGDSAAGIMVPLYTYPGGTWDTVAQVKRAHSDVPIVAIVNPASGPGSSKDSNYESGIAELKDAGVTVLGYVSTAYANRDLAAVKGDMDRWQSWYPAVDGIFFDEQTNWAGHESYYAEADRYAKSKGMPFTVGNPGANSIPSYLDTVDVVLIYESPGLPNVGNYQSWSSADNNKLGMIPFGVGSMPNQWIEDATSLVGWIYVTNDMLPNPWDSLPPYFENMADLLGDGTTSTPPSEPSTPRHTLTVKSVDQNGRAADGMWMEVKKGTTTVSSGFTPLTVILEESTYSVSASDYQQITFDRWSDGTESATVSLRLSSNTALTAYYNNGPVASSLSAGLSADANSAPAGSTINFDVTVSGGTSPYTWSVNFGDGTTSSSSSASVSKKYDSVGTYNAQATVRDSAGRTATSSPMAITITSESSTLQVETVDSDGNALDGYFTTLSQDGSQLQSAFSPASFSLDSGETYEVSVADYGDYVFSKWDDGSTSRTRTVSGGDLTTLTAYYTTNQATLTVSSEDTSGDAIAGLWTVIKKDGTTVETGYTPLSYTGEPGTYEVTVSDYQNYEFDHWDNDSTSSTRRLSVSGEVELTAFYSTEPSEVKLTVRTASLNGSPITGLWTVIDSDGSETTGFSPVSYDAVAGNSYTISVADYRNYVFDHWEDGSKDRFREISPDDDTVIIAYYKR